ncbi:trypco2 family protein [uncultured Thiothrix sp.]|uniref:trypco2 family protein n=1 Tax=uncultured Thiothrix sp. TaxID=223185 RepID=UPI00262E7D0B|nr:trypco2 family protein [uncultured Thiothrix sp.]HMT94189.1 hypothetical protein [Thiolinea sp.]
MSTGSRQLVEIITALRSDIEAAIKEGEGKIVRFDLEEVEVELHTQITKSGNGVAGVEVEFKVLGFDLGKASAEAAGEYAKEQAHTIRLKLKPKRINPSTQQVEDVQIADFD